MTTRGRAGWSLAWLLLLALGFRLGVQRGVARHPDSFAPVVDSEAYLLQAMRVAAGAPLVRGVTFQAPLYPWLLGPLLAASGEPGSTAIDRVSQLPPARRKHVLKVARAWNVLLGLLLVALLWRLGSVLFSPAAGWLAGLLAAVSSPLAFYEGHALKVSLSLVFLPWAVLAARRAWIAERTRGAHRPWIWVGLALGLGGLVRGNLHLLVWLAVLARVLWSWRRRQLSGGLRGAAWLLLGAWAALAPLVLRNSLVAGRPVLSTAAGGTAFFLCNHAGNHTGLVQYTALNRQIPRYEQADWRGRAEQAVGRPLTPGEVSRYWMGRALGDIAADPGAWLLLELRKLGLLFSRYEAPDNTLVALGEEQLPWLAVTPSRWELILPLACAGLFLAWRQRRRGTGPGGASALALATGGYAASLLLFNISSRFRMPLEPLGMLWAGLFLARLPSLARDASWGTRLGLAGVLLLGLGASRVSETALGPLDGGERAGHLAVRHLNISRILRERGDLAAARAELERATRVASQAGLQSPEILTDQGVLDRAEALESRALGDGPAAARAESSARRRAEQALAVSPEHEPALRLLGLLAYDAGRLAEAAEWLQQALRRVPLDRDARQYLCLSLLAVGDGEQALAAARELLAGDAEDDAAQGLLVLALLAVGDRDGARATLADYDRLAAAREQAGLPRRLPDQPVFQSLRSSSP